MIPLIDSVGRYGTMASVFLRIGQVLFAGLSVMSLAITLYVMTTYAIWFSALMAFMGCQACWSFIMMVVELCVAKEGVDLRAHPYYFTLIFRWDVLVLYLSIGSTSVMVAMLLFYFHDVHMWDVRRYDFFRWYLCSAIFASTSCILASLSVGIAARINSSIIIPGPN
ncbi:uncharacterized protein [Spinacia oleracea]|uniref:CASP-like protein n=1 Tax=Spinacia oleracea TaxID=3562 RepID=A0ABM3R1M5_SPIOL|nr:uncharacterized protein LOC110801330 [Spinacia oleracea]